MSAIRAPLGQILDTFSISYGSRREPGVAAIGVGEGDKLVLGPGGNLKEGEQHLAPAGLTTKPLAPAGLTAKHLRSKQLSI